jgi:hypothetical protein
VQALQANITDFGERELKAAQEENGRKRMADGLTFGW